MSVSLPRRRRSESGGTYQVPPTREVKIEAIRDFWAFIDMINFQGGASRFGECHRDLVAWSDAIEPPRRELILMPRGHLKSTLMTVARTLHRIYQNPNIRIFVGTATRELAGAFVREIKTYFEDPWLQEHVWNDRPHYPGRLVPSMDRGGQRRSRALSEEEFERDLWDEQTEAEDKKTVWRGTAIQVLRPYIMKEPTVTVGAVGVQPTGFHFDEMKLDDIINYDNVSTPTKRAKVISWIDDLISVLDDPYIDVDFEDTLKRVGIVDTNLAVVGGAVTACGTRYDREDWYGDIIQRDAEGTTRYRVYQRNIYKNGENSADGYLWWERWNVDVEADKRNEMTATRFASQYLNAIVAVDEQLLSPSRMKQFTAYSTKLLDSGVVRVTLQGDVEHLIHPMMVIDPAAALGSEADFTAIVVGGKDREGNLFILDGSLGRWKAAETVKQLYYYADKWRLRRVQVEAVGGFKHFAEYIRSQFQKYRPLLVVEFRPSGKKEVRIANALEPLVTNGMLYICSHVLLSNEIKDQFLFFPRPTVHDDFPDACAALCELSKPPLAKPVQRLRAAINRDYGGYR